MGDTITYEFETLLPGLDGLIYDAVLVAITIEPADAGALIYGYNAVGNIQPVRVPGGTYEAELPFVSPQIYVKYLKGLKSFRIGVRGHVDRRASPGSGEIPRGQRRQ